MALAVRWSVVLAVAIAVNGRPGVCAAPAVGSPVVGTPATVQFNQFQLGSNDLPLTDPLLAPYGGPNTPEQIHITLGSGPQEMYITWVTGVAMLSAVAPQAPSNNLTSQVCPCLAMPQQSLTFLLTGKAGSLCTLLVLLDSFIAAMEENNTGMTVNAANNYYTSGSIHTVLLSNLMPDTTYHYRVGDFMTNAPDATSAEYSFKTGRQIGESSFPQTIGLVADVGLTSNSTVTLQHLIANEPEIALFVGDLIYADDYTADGKSAYDYPAIYRKGSLNVTLPVKASTYQFRWDGFGRAMQQIANTTQGNHEIERDSAKHTFQSWSARYPNPYKQSKSTSPLYYSFDYGGAHYVQIGAYEGPGKASAQYRYPNGNYPHTIISSTQLAWLEADLAAVNRSRTPWVIAQTHPPYYNTYNQHYKEVQCFQQQVEPLLVKYGVNFVFFGHVHAYERTWPVNNYKLDPCGPVNIIIGDGGNVEGTYKDFVDTSPPGNCSVPLNVLNAPGNYTPLCATAEVYAPGQPPSYCPPKGTQPYYSAYREPSFGHGILKLLSPYEATWTWHRNQNSSATVSDSVTVVRNTSCPNQLQAGAALAPANSAPAPVGLVAGAG
ncbi:g10610 [Coccomyxa viridis]|uniref:Purple acid phosphatase n=1 Tax=Coccomyxa viridis TaxID=1274662 RepID=A0ABP1GCU0_9CHLO